MGVSEAQPDTYDEGYIQLLWLYLFLFYLMIEDSDFVLMYYVETSHLICGVDHLSGFYLVYGIERNIVIFTGLYVFI